jgi:hypothetical protein
MHDGPLTLRNMTPEIEEWLDKIGVESAQEFLKLGAKKIYLLLLEAGHEPQDELRCRLIGAEQDIDWHIIAERDSHRAKSRFADVDEP